MSTLQPLYGMTPAELGALAAAEGLPRFAAGQMARWLYRRHAPTIDAMTDLSAPARVRLASRYEVGRQAPCRADVSSDGTKKYLFATRQGAFVESAYIPDRDRRRSASPRRRDAAWGAVSAPPGSRGSPIRSPPTKSSTRSGRSPSGNVLPTSYSWGWASRWTIRTTWLAALGILTSEQGFGWSPTRITVSTAGVGSDLERLLRETQVHVAVSLHNPFPEERAAIMPVERAWPLHGLLDTLRRCDFSHQRRLSFEYILLAGLNDSPRHLRELVRLLGGMHCRINLIRFHRIPGSPFFSPPEEEIVRFRDGLTRRGIMTTVRASRGEDIRAACGLLSTVRTNLE